MSNHVNIIVEDDRWTDAVGFGEWNGMVGRLLDATVRSMYDGDMGFYVNLLLTGDSAIRKLNLDFRGIDSSTNVLSFPQYESRCIKDLLEDGGVMGCQDDAMVGDVAMSFDAVTAESIQYGKSLWDRCSHLFVHGVLHLFGMDHIDHGEAEAMERLEMQILELFGVRDPYALVTDKQVERYHES
ncbi:MAG: rRNA maturation RNase YbeY [Holosporales bacterium]|jgi:probable rRNA maturation factor|nr:rRNA maturation RNase YbeY [Holosporales bacterium]